MNNIWSRHASDRQALPIEMRFIDLFMAALGALLFMAMLLALLLKYIPKEIGDSSSPQATAPSEQLQILSRSLPEAETGKSYEMAIAYRGGAGAVVWEVAAGQQEIPTGMSFNREQGILMGTPGKEGIARFVVRARDKKGAVQEQAYELSVHRARSNTRFVEWWLAGIMLSLLILFLLSTHVQGKQTKQLIIKMESAYQLDERYFDIETGPGTYEHIELPEGITTYHNRLRAFKKLRKYLGFIILFLAIWFFWRLWSH